MKNLRETHPKIALEWHKTKNKSTPSQFTYGSNKKVWWKCPVKEDHEWEAVIASRTKGYGCPCCSSPIKKIVKSNCLATTNPKLCEEWHQKNELSIYEVCFGSGKKVWWKCNKENDHVWKASIEKRVKGRGCPFCDGKKVAKSNCLKTTHPEISNQWHPTKNTESPNDVVSGSDKKIWWICDENKNHIWKAAIKKRTANQGCPFCKLSKGEKKIKNILENQKIKYEKEKTFESCKNKIKLRFDFFAMEKFLIEYNGSQHYKPMKFRGGDEKFKQIQKNDNIKKIWCESNNIPLLIIPYWEFKNIEKIINEFISSQNF